MKLKSFATAFTGVNATKLDKNPSSEALEVKVITGQSIDCYGLFDAEHFQSAWIDSVLSERLFLQQNDIVVQIRGNVFKAGIFKSSVLNVNMSYVASSNFAILRVDPDVLAPEIIVAYLNSSFFKNNVIATTRSNTLLITLKALLEQQISILKHSEQEQLINLFYSFAELQKKTMQLYEQQSLVAEAKLFDVLNKSGLEGGNTNGK